jgi:hypothetical protein
MSTGTQSVSLARFLESRRLTEDTLTFFGVAINELSADQTRLRIRVDGQHNRFTLTYEIESKRFRAEPGSSQGNKPYNVANAEAALAEDPEAPLYLVPGIFDVWALHEAGIDSAVATAGAYRSFPERVKWAAAIAARHGRQLVIWNDTRIEETLRQLVYKNPGLEIIVVDWALSPADTWRAVTFGDAMKLARIDVTQALLKAALARLRTAKADTKLRDLQDILFATRKAPAIDALVELVSKHPDLERLIEEKVSSGPDPVRRFILELLPESEHDRDRELETWIEQHGSPMLKHALSRSYDVTLLALSERAEKELNPDSASRQFYVDALPKYDRTLVVGERNHPSREAVELEMKMIEHLKDPDQVSIVFIKAAPDGCPGGEVIKVTDYLGLYDVYVAV